MIIPFFQVDAFTSNLFGGNPAGVCPLNSWLPDHIMQSIATENNLSETAFFVESGDHFEITWFTPVSEVDLCGHATLASAHVLFHHLGYKKDTILFSTRKRGELIIKLSDQKIAMDFPAMLPSPVKAPAMLVEGLRAKPLETYLSRDYLVILPGEEDVLAVDPDFEKLARLNVTGIIISAPGKEVDFVSRFFAPSVGINEDPVTGSAHTTLIPFWANRLGKDHLTAWQLSKRKGEIYCENHGKRVIIKGDAVTYLEGEISLPENF